MEKRRDKNGWTAGEDVHDCEATCDWSDGCGEALLELPDDVRDVDNDESVEVKLLDDVAAARTFPAKLAVDVATAVET